MKTDIRQILKILFEKVTFSFYIKNIVFDISDIQPNKTMSRGKSYD